MSLSSPTSLRPIALERAALSGGFLGAVQGRIISETLPAITRNLHEVGAFRALAAVVSGEKIDVHPFWDSDIGKWMEAVSYGLYKDRSLAARLGIDEAIAALRAAQDRDGYLNTYYSIVEPGRRFEQLAFGHELYNAGHLIEGAVAHYQATGSRDMLDIATRYADHIVDVFGPGKREGYPGHPEIELALVKLYRATGERKYLDLSRLFLYRRGQKPSIFEAEIGSLSPRHQDWFQRFFYRGGETFSTEYCQDHLPVTEQEEAVGHAVRAMYLYSGMVDVGTETDDEALVAAARRLWRDVVSRRMYVTGGIGSSEANEGFTSPYDLPNETAYAETCAAIGLVFLSHRLLQVDPDRRYADVMERALYNAVLSGLSLDGSRFFYDSPLASDGGHQRQPWFEVACCPPNLARLLLSIGQYALSERGDEGYIHLFAAGRYQLHLSGGPVDLEIATDYPWDGRVTVTVASGTGTPFALNYRIPGWARGVEVRLNGEPIDPAQQTNGYGRVERSWASGDRLEIQFPLPVERIVAHPRVAANRGLAALQRGPIVYCVEQADCAAPLDHLLLGNDEKLRAAYRANWLGGVSVIEGEISAIGPWSSDELYQSAPIPVERVSFTAVPFYAWSNREPGAMRVWLPLKAVK